jgi:hypothetical protein
MSTPIAIVHNSHVRSQSVDAAKFGEQYTLEHAHTEYTVAIGARRTATVRTFRRRLWRA